MTCGRMGSGLIPDLWRKPLCQEVLWPFLDAWDSVRLRTASTQSNVPERYGPHGELFFFLLKKEPRVLSKLVRASISAEKVKACALIALHMMAEGEYLAVGQWLFCVVQVARVKASWVMTRCSSSGHTDPATQFPSSFKTGKSRTQH